jgi:hypothetical protein
MLNISASQHIPFINTTGFLFPVHVPLHVIHYSTTLHSGHTNPIFADKHSSPLYLRLEMSGPPHAFRAFVRLVPQFSFQNRHRTSVIRTVSLLEF